MPTKCLGCKKPIEGNPRFVLKIMRMGGYYDEYDFHNLKCFLNHIFKKHRKKFEKRYL